MQGCAVLSPQYTQNQIQLQKTTSLPHFEFKQNIEFSIQSDQTIAEGYWRSASKWIMRLRRRSKLSKSTLYLAVSYLLKLVRFGFILNEANYEMVAATLVLMSAKMNQIYPPKMSFLASRCSKYCTKDDLAHTQALILQYFNYDFSFSEISYSYLMRILNNQIQSKIQDAEKLLGLAVTEKKVIQQGQQTVAYAIIYLVKPSLARECGYQNIQKIKNVATKVYNLYISNKSAPN